MRGNMMTGLAVVVATAFMTGCGSGDGGSSTDGAPTRRVEASAPPAVPVVLPPSIRANRTMRCSDNSLLFVEFYSDDMTASVRTDEKAKAVRLAAPSKTTPMVADGWSLIGRAGDGKVTLSSPGHPRPMVCHV